MLIKICGLTRKEDVLLCAELEVDLLGFIFHRKSPRFISPDALASFPGGRGGRVGVFVRESVSRIEEISHAASLDLVQLHGEYTPEQCRALGSKRVIKAFWPEKYPGPEEFAKDLERFAPCCRYFLFDSGQTGGGHGTSLQTEWIRQVESPRPWFLAGGLCPKNVHNFILRFKPDGIDMNSGVEKEPGVKNSTALRESVNMLKGRNQ